MAVFYRKKSFESQMDRLFDDAIRVSSISNLYEDENNFCVQLVPDSSANQTAVQLEGDTLRVNREPTSKRSERIWYTRESEEEVFEWAFKLPSHVNRDGAHASYEAGIHTVTFPKMEKAKRRQIPIQGPNDQIIQGEKQERTIKDLVITASLFFAGLIGLGAWSAWRIVVG